MNLNYKPYAAMPRATVTEDNIVLRAVTPDDIEDIRCWRNTQMSVLRQTHIISKNEQEHYFETYVWPDKSSSNPKQILLAIELDRAFIGYGGLVHIDWEARRAEISFLLNPQLENDGSALSLIFEKYLRLIHKLSFVDLKLNKLTTETYAHRHVHIEILSRCGHKLEGTLKQHVIVDGVAVDSLLHGLLATEWACALTHTEAPGILLTSSSSKISFLSNLEDAAKRLPTPHRVIAGDADGKVLTKYVASDFWQLPSVEFLNVNKFISDCRQKNIAFIIPSRDAELEFWANLKPRFKDAGIHIIVSDVDSIRLCLDKLAFANFGGAFNLPIIPASSSPDAFAGQLVVKERYGSGSINIKCGVERTAALDFAKNLNVPIFQPYIIGPEISVDAWLDASSHPVGIILRTRDKVLNGESQVTTTFFNNAIENELLRVLKALKLQGHVVIQAILGDAGLSIIECNPRFGGASSVAIEAGLDSLHWSLVESLGVGSPPQFKRRNHNVKQVRIPTDKYFYGYNF